MNRVLNIFILLLMFCFCVCCGSSSHIRLLDRAESVIEFKPDSAYNILSSIKFDDIQSDALRARFALLYTKAQDKKQIRLDNDSLTNIALNYFQHNGSSFHRASAYFYSARVDYNNRNISDAVKKLTYAMEIVPCDSLYLKGLIVGAIALCYDTQMDHHNALINYEIEYDIFRQLGIKHNQANSLFNQSKQYGLLKDYDKAIVLNRASREIYRKLQDTLNMLSCDLIVIKWRIRNREVVSEVRNSFFTEREEYHNYPKSESEYSVLAELYGRDKMLDSAIYYMELSLISTDTTTIEKKIVCTKKAARIAALKGHKNRAIKLLQTANTYIEQSYMETLKNSVYEIKEKYKGELYREESLRHKSQRNNVIICSIAFAMLLICLFFLLVKYYRNRLRKLDEDLGIAQDLVQSVANSINRNTSTNETSTTEHKYSSNVNYMMTKLNTFIERMPRYENEPQKFITEFVNIMHNGGKAKRARTIFYEIIDGDFTGVLCRIKEKYGLDGNEIEILCMLALGVSNSAIRIIMNHTNNRTVYNYRSSIKQKLNIDIDSKSILDLLYSEMSIKCHNQIS